MFPINISAGLNVFSKDFDFFKENLSTVMSSEFNNEKSLNFKNTSSGIEIIGAFGRFAWKGFNLLNGVSKVNLNYEQKENQLRVSYKLFFNEAFYIALLFSIIPLFTSPQLDLNIKTEQYSVQILLFIIIWLVFYFGNMLISFLRFHFFLKKRIKNILDLERNYILEKQLEKIEKLKKDLKPDLFI